MFSVRSLIIFSLAGVTAFSSLACGDPASKQIRLLNVSYDPTRELYEEINSMFAKKWKSENPQSIQILQSHGGSGKQARSVIDGLEADVVTLALAHDINALHEKADLVPADWQSRLPFNSAPYTSTVVFLVRKGNPKNIQDWEDLVRPDVAVITPNPKTSGGARWNYLAAWAYAMKKSENYEAKAQEFISRLFQNVPVLDTGARGSLTTFVERGIGDVFLSWEDEALLTLKQKSEDQYEIVIPSISILAEPSVAMVDKVVMKKNTEKAARAYLEFLYTPEAQEAMARHFYRPRDTAVLEKYRNQFPVMNLVSVDDPILGGWKKVQEKHFSDGGVFDQIYQT